MKGAVLFVGWSSGSSRPRQCEVPRWRWQQGWAEVEIWAQGSQAELPHSGAGLAGQWQAGKTVTVYTLAESLLKKLHLCVLQLQPRHVLYFICLHCLLTSLVGWSLPSHLQFSS